MGDDDLLEAVPCRSVFANPANAMKIIEGSLNRNFRQYGELKSR